MNALLFADGHPDGADLSNVDTQLEVTIDDSMTESEADNIVNNMCAGPGAHHQPQDLIESDD